MTPLRVPITVLTKSHEPPSTTLNPINADAKP